MREKLDEICYNRFHKRGEFDLHKIWGGLFKDFIAATTYLCDS
ncbi:hypothetical protein MNB_SV-6-1716 [hydrothermal vent metagenome]|uniref:Uncharacterized protein n=1 Tax=hydrothermal vent metagenome TaxID=652676 RepID=A0A1W1B9S9_9ZZZZ